MQLDVIVPTHNSAAYIGPCLRSTREALAFAAARMPLTFRVWVVDTRSEDATCSRVREWGAGVHLLCLERNVGFAAAVNTVIPLTRGHVWLLNPDTRPERESLWFLLQRLEEARVGAVGPALVRPDGRVAPESARRFPSLFREGMDKVGLATRWPARWGGYYLGGVEVPRPVPVLSGAALLVRREAWDAVKGLDERFWMYGEDTDLCRRLGDEGWVCFYEPRARVYHVGGGSGSPERRLELGLAALGSMAYYFEKHHGPRAAGAYRLLMRGLALLKWVYWSLRGDAYHRAVQRAVLTFPFEPGPPPAAHPPSGGGRDDPRRRTREGGRTRGG